MAAMTPAAPETTPEAGAEAPHELVAGGLPGDGATSAQSTAESGAEAASEASSETPSESGGSAKASVVDVLGKVRSIKGTHALAILLVINSAFLVLNYVSARHNRSVDQQRQRDAVVVRDVARVTETWTKLPDGMILVMRPTNPTDADAVKIIRRSLRWQRTQYLRGDYSDAKFGTKDIPGRADLEWGSINGLLNVRYRDLDDGGELHWITTDSVMLDSLDEWGTNVATGEFPDPLPTPESAVTTSTVPVTTVPVSSVPVSSVPVTAASAP